MEIELGADRDGDLASAFAGPTARIVLAVVQQALLSPMGVKQMVVGLHRDDGRFVVLAARDSSDQNGADVQFGWVEAAPLISLLRQGVDARSGTTTEFEDRYVYRYRCSVGEHVGDVVVGAIMDAEPATPERLHAAISSAVYTLLPESDSDIPDASVVVSVDAVADGLNATVSCATDEGHRTHNVVADNRAEAIAKATIAASGSQLTLRYADQVGVDGQAVSLVVAGDDSVAVVGASSLVSPGGIAPALATLKAVNALARVAAEVESAERAFSGV